MRGVVFENIIFKNMISEFALEGVKYVILPKKEYDKLLLMASKNELKNRLFSFYEARKRSEEMILEFGKTKKE